MAKGHNLNTPKVEKESYFKNINDLKIFLSSIRKDQISVKNANVMNHMLTIKKYVNDDIKKLTVKEIVYCFLNDFSDIKCTCGELKLWNNGNKGYRNSCGNKQCSINAREELKTKKVLEDLSPENTELLKSWNIEISEKNRMLINQINKGTSDICSYCGKPILKSYNNTPHCSTDCRYKNKTFLKDRAKKGVQSRKDNGYNGFGVSYEDIENGITNTSQKQSTKEKIKETNIENFGHENSFHSPKARENFDNIDWDESIKNNQNTLLEKYGVTNIMRVPEINNKVQAQKEKTCLEKYGYSNVFQVPYFKDKISISRRNLFNEARINDDYKGIVYLFHSKQLKKVKIGLTKSDNVYNRFNGIKRDIPDLTIINYFHSNSCYFDENYLHHKYKKYNVVLEEKIGGRTEWFDDILLEELNKIYDNKKG